VAIDRSGYLYAANDTNQRIDVFAPSGRRVLSWGSKGSAPGQLVDPTGIAIGKDGSVYVVDNGNARVEKFSPIR
jgi:DNA-binding beta-propeller fold protein YncE